MFADLWVISLLILYGASGFLLLWALPAGIQIIHGWNFSSSSEKQLYLERKNYLVSALLQYALFFQIILLLFFLQLVNTHLPGLIKGAMCAAGTLSVNVYGYPALYIKIASVFIYLSFLFVNHLDQSETDFPLTPKKFYLLFVSVLIFVLDVYVTVSYFAGIKPDVIAACCSVNLSSNSAGVISVPLFSEYVQQALALFYVLGVTLVFLLLRLRTRLLYLILFITPVFVFADILALKYHFVKFIYGMPAHTCLFDIFWGEYYFAGYLIFGTLATYLAGVLLLILLKMMQAIHLAERPHLERKLKWLAVGGLVGHLLILSLYWLYWII